MSASQLQVTDKISQFVSYGEVVHSDTADRMKIDNSLPDILLPKIKLVATNIIDPTRIHFGKPANINSFYRCPALNQLLSNRPDSQHTKGEAVDFTIQGFSNEEVVFWLRRNLNFDQLILEFSWIHCSFVAAGNRKEVLCTTDGRTYKPY